MFMENTDGEQQKTANTSERNVTQATATEKPEKRRIVVGPWKNVEEFEKVYDRIFGPYAGVETKKRALRQIRIWNLRRSTQCPAAVLATSVIIEVQIQDKENYQNLQTLYASAFTRFFNFMSSIMQTYNMRTMYDTAKQLGLNSFVVDLRHLCAHGQVLPPLNVLRKTIQYCLTWLHDYYWAVQLKTMCNVDAKKIRRRDKTKFDESITELFNVYDSALQCFMKEAETLKKSKSIIYAKQYIGLKAYWEHRKAKNFKDVLDGLVKDLNTLIKRETFIRDLGEIFVEALLQMSYFYVAADCYCNDEEFEKLLDGTCSLFRMLAANSYLETLFYSLLRITENSNDSNVRRKGASFWAVQILEGYLAIRKSKEMYKAELNTNENFKQVNFSANNNNSYPSLLRKLMIYSGVNMKQTLLFGDALRYPWIWIFDISFIETHLESLNEYSAPVLKKLLPLIEPGLSDDEIESAGWLIDTLFKTSVLVKETDDMTNNTDKIYTANDFLKLLEEHNTPCVVSEDIVSKQDLGVWSEVPDNTTQNWTTCPLGRLPWD